MSTPVKNSFKEIVQTCGFISVIGALYFLLSVLLLGFVQPGYNHVIDTISVLVLGKYGWIQQINFVVLAVSFGCLGIGLGLFFYKKFLNRITAGFLLLSLCVIFVLLFKADPVDRTQIKLVTLHSQAGLIHLSTTFVMVILIPLFFIDLIKKLFGSNQNKGLARYTIFVILFNVIFGILWFYCRRVGVGFEIKGIWQKVLALNVLIWMMVMGKWLYSQNIK